MKFCNRLFYYILVISFCSCHDLHHVDPTKVKQSESSEINKNVNVQSTITTATIVQTEPNIPVHSEDVVKQTTANTISTTTTATIVQTEQKASVQSQHVQPENVAQQTTITTPTPVSKLSSTPVTTTVQTEQNIPVHPRHVQSDDLAKQTTPIPVSKLSKLTTASIVPSTTTATIVQTEEPITTTTEIPIINPKLILKSDEILIKRDDLNKTVSKNMTISISNKTRQICWHLPKTFEPSIQLLENQILRSINLLPDFVQTIFFGRIDDREILLNTMWLSSICTMCGLFSFLFLSMGTKRLQQTKQEKEVRVRCQHLQQVNNQVELERATFERQNIKLSEQINELKSLTVRDSDEELYTLRAEYQRYQEELQTVCYERDNFKREFELKQNLIRKYENDAQENNEIISNLNHQIIQLKQELDKDRHIITRLQSGDISLERFEKSQEFIQELKSEISKLKQEKFSQQDQITDLQQYNNEIDIKNYQLTLKIKQIFEQIKAHELQTIFNEILIEQNIEKSTEHIRDLHSELTEKTNRIKQLENLIKQEQIRCREFETKLKVILELRERDAQLHIRQLGQIDGELRKARTDTDRIRILQQQFDLKQQQLDDVQKLFSSEQMKFNEECTKLQHEIHDKWMEVKRLTRELDGSKKECENYRKQITQYANKERSLQDKSFVKQIAQHIETNKSSPIGHSYGEKYDENAMHFRSIDQQRHDDSGAISPNDMFIPRPNLGPPMFPLPRPPFFPPHPNAFIMHPRFPISIPSHHGMMSPIPPLMVNNNENNQSELLDTSNSILNDLNGSSAADSSYKENVDGKKLKSKKSKKKTRISTTKEEV